MQSPKSVETLLKSTYPLQIAIRCSETVETICQKNSLSFVELLRPFCSLNGPYTLKDVQGHQYTVRNVVVKVTAPYGEPVPDAKLRIDLGNCVKWCSGEEGKTPWFDKYRDTFLDHLKQSDHECIKHYVCVVMVVSSTVANPLEAFSQLLTAQKQSEQQSKYPKWLTPHLLYQYVLLHDLSEGGDERARDNYAKVEGTYGGASCFFLHINSRASGSPGKNVPDLWSDLLRSGSETNDDEVDGRFKLKLRKSNKSSKESSPIVPNNKGKSPTNNAVPDPNSARKEPTLFTISTSDSDLNNSQAVAVGNDPLTQNSGTIHHALSNADFTGGESCEKYVTNGSIEGGRETGSVRYGQCLKIEDHERLAGFVQELVGKRLLPHLSEVLKNLNEWLLSRRSVRRSFSSFSSKIAKMIQGPSNSAGEGVGYATNSMEVQLRQLADLAFLTQNYDLSFQSYHHVKKDFQSSSAWSYYAAAVEMCAVAAYMCSSSKREVVSYLEEAVSVYNLSCKAPYHALRCSLLLCKILQERGLTRELTQLFIRMTSEDDDLRSALCLEQAAHSFQRAVPSMERKFALHLILAGHRYARSTQRLHSTRVYGQALKVYIDKGWTLAEDYIHFSLARHSFTLHRLSEARRAFEALLSHDSRQSTAQQMLNLKEYIFVYKQLQSLEPSPPTLPVRPPTSTLSQVSQATPLPTLPLPFVNNRLTRVTLLTGAPPTSLNRPHSLAGGDQSNSSTSLGQYLNSKKQQSGNSLANLIIGVNDYDHSKMKATKDDWVKMEKRAAAGMGGVLHENFKPSVLIMDEASDNSSSPVMVVNEPVSVGLVLRNPLKIPLLMTNVALIWSYSTPGTSVSSLPASNEERPPPEASCDVLDTVLLKPEEERMVTLRITPHKEGHLAVTGFLYNLCIDTTQSESTDSPVLSSQTRPNLPSMAVSTQDVLYQKRHSSGVSEVMATGLQGKVDVCIQGQRLNQTKEERAGVVYGADHRLSWTVAAPMPKIVACLNSLPSALNRGEVCRVAMEVYNCGQVPLNSLRIATSLGGKLLFDKECDTSSSGVYPATLLSPINTSPPPTHPLPHTITPPHCVELSLPSGRLEPGVGVCAKLIMQGTSSLTSTRQGWGEIPLDLLIYYEPALVSANSKLSHRVLRHSCSLKINESLNLKATAVHAQLPITSSDKEHFDLNRVLLTVEAENKLSPGVAGEVRITQVSCVSPSWSITKTDRGQGLLCLQPSESGVVQLRGTRLPTHTTNLCYSDVPLGPTVIPSSVFPTGNLLRTEESIQKPKRDQLSLVVFWQALVTGEADTMFTYGHQTISVKLPQSMSTLAQTEPTSPYDIVKFYLEHPLVSDYPPSGLCVVPVRVVLQNCCSSNVTAMLEMMQPKEQIEDTHNRSVEPQFYWSGGTCRRHVSLSADSASSSITIHANFGKPGVYNLNTLRVLVAKGNGGGYSTQRWQRTSYITIK